MRASSLSERLVSIRSLSNVLLVLYAVLLALGLGLGSAYWVMNEEPPFGVVRLGPWKAWPKLGSPEADPYMRAIMARRGEVPLAAGEGLTLIAAVDSEERRLDSACAYRIGFTVPAARLWTLTAYDEAGRLVNSELGRSGFTSAEVIRDSQDRFQIAMARSLQPGNWLQLPASGPFTIALRLYDPPGAAGSILSDDTVFPSIERLECGA